MIFRVGGALVVMFGVSACDGLFRDDARWNEWECRYVDIPDDEPAPSTGLVPADVALRIEGTRTATGAWLTPPAEFAWTPDSGEPEVELTLARGDGSAAEAEGCGPHVRIPVVLGIRTSDGALDEVLDGELRAWDLDPVHISAPFDFAELAGSLEATSIADGVELVRPAVGVLLAFDGMSGSVGAVRQEADPRSSSVAPDVPLLRWPASSPCEASMGGPADVTVPFGPTNPVWTTWVSEGAAASWTGVWQDGTSADFELAIVTAGVACVSLDQIYLPANVTLRSADGRLDQRFSGRWDGDDSQATFQASTRSGVPVDAEAALAAFGLADIDPGAYDSLGIYIELTLGPDGGQGVWHVVGYVDTCEPVCDANSCSGCPPMAEVILLELTFQSQDPL